MRDRTAFISLEPSRIICYRLTRFAAGGAPTMACGRGGIGRRAALRSLCRKAWKFESSRPHHDRLNAGPSYPDIFGRPCVDMAPDGLLSGDLSSPIPREPIQAGLTHARPQDGRICR